MNTVNVSECIHSTLDGAVIIAVTVQPSARRNGFTGLDDWRQTLNISVKSPAKEGKANAELISVIAEELKVSKSSIQISTGHSSRSKKIRIEGIRISDLIKRLEELL